MKHKKKFLPAFIYLGLLTVALPALIGGGARRQIEHRQKQTLWWDRPETRATIKTAGALLPMPAWKVVLIYNGRLLA